MRRATHDVVAHVDGVHDVEREQRDMRRLEHVAAGVEDDVGRFRGGALRARVLAEACELRIGQLHLRKMRDIARDQPETFDAGLALLARLVSGARHCDTGHVKEKARVGAVVTHLDAFAREHAGACPFARGLRPVAGAQNVEHTRNRRLRIGVLNAGSCRNRTGFEAFAAACAGVHHGVDAGLQGGLEGVGLKRNRHVSS
jgi:hypothetical protein